MIETIKNCVDLVCIFIRHTLFISYKLGYFLVNTISSLQNIIIRIVYLLVEVFGAIFESFASFFQDVIQNIQNITRTISTFDIVTYLYDVGNIVVQSIVFIVIILSDFVAKFILGVFTGIYSVFLTPKYVLFYFIKNIWSLIAYIRDMINDITTFVVESIALTAGKARDLCIAGILFWTNSPKVIYNFVTDIPAESLIAIMISCCLIYLFVRFYIIFFTFLYRQLGRFFWNMQRTYIKIQRYFTRSTRVEQVVYRRQVLPSRRPRIRADRNLSKSEENDRYCIICQEQMRSVLLLPCRHLCMCAECVDTLQTYHDTCPICRSDIERTMQVFV